MRCNEFLTTEKHKAVHDFLRHYDDGKSIPLKEKPLDILRYPALTIYSIEFQKHSNFYSFYNSEKCVDDFLKNIKYRFKSVIKSGLNVHLIFKIHKILLDLI